MTSSLIKRLQKAGINSLLLGILLAAASGFWFPGVGVEESGIPWKAITGYGVAFIFFFYGLKLDRGSLFRGLANWRLHLLVQTSTYLIFPLVVWLLLPLASSLSDELKTGIIFLSVLPSTVSGAVVLVSIAKGNIPAAIFNASVSSLLGVIMTPFWMFVFAGTDTVAIDFGSTVSQLALKILLPVIIGMFLHPVLFKIVDPYFSKIKYIDQLVIMAIVFTSFSEAVNNEVFVNYDGQTIIVLIVSEALLYFLMLTMIYFISKAFGFGLEDRIAATFCGSKKSLIQGVVMGKVIFPDPVLLSIMIVPIMLYHVQQLVYGSLLAGYLKEIDRPEA